MGSFFPALSVCQAEFAPNPEGYGIGRESEWQQVADATRSFPPSTVFATYPTYNHPVLVNGHRVVMGFPGHLWSHGLNYRPVEVKLMSLMNSEPAGKKSPKNSVPIILFWGPLEETNYPDSEKEWEEVCRLVAEGTWGRIYDLHGFSSPAEVAKPPSR